MRDDPESVENRKRYGQLIVSAQEIGSLWIAESADSILVLTNESGEELILVWPSEGVARQVLSARPDLAQFQPVSRTLDRWLSTSTPNLVEDGVNVAANPDEKLRCFRVSAGTFARDLAARSTLQGSDIARLKREVRRRGK